MTLLRGVIAEVLEEVEQSRVAYDEIDPCTIREITDLALTLGATRASRFWENVEKVLIPRPTISKYLSHYKKKEAEGAPVHERYFVPEKAGRPCALSQEETEAVLETIKILRGKKKSVTASSVSVIARGVVKRVRPDLIENGVVVLGVDWAKKFMHRHGLVVRATQTDRTCSAEEVVLGAKEFYGKLTEIASTMRVEPWSVFNMDEFFSHLGNCRGRCSNQGRFHMLRSHECRRRRPQSATHMGGRNHRSSCRGFSPEDRTAPPSRLPLSERRHLQAMVARLLATMECRQAVTWRSGH
jgi:hypothetical protein